MVVRIIFQEFESFTCDLVIENPDKKIQEQTITAPKIILEQQFLEIAKRIASAKNPLKVTLKRKVQIWDQFDQKHIEREYSVSFLNNEFVAVEEDRTNINGEQI